MEWDSGGGSMRGWGSPMGRWTATWNVRCASAWTFTVFALGACAGIPAPPDPISLEIARPESLARGPSPLWASSDPYRWWTAAPVAPRPPLPSAEPIIEWSPQRPSQAFAVRLRIRQPAGAALEDVRVRFAGEHVSLARDAAGWIGVGSLPLDSAGFFPLELEFRRKGIAESRLVVVRSSERIYPSSRIRIGARPGAATAAEVNPELDARIARERETIQTAIRTSVDTEWVPDEPFRWPRQPPIKTSPFGQRRIFNGSVQSRHMGLDLRARRGNPIMAPAAGRVILADRFVYQGNAVYLDHGLGLVTAYFHMSRLEVEVGDLVRPGQVLGRSGSTGRSTAPHLHWSASVNGRSIDPESLVGFSIDLPRGAVPVVGSR